MGTVALMPFYWRLQLWAARVGVQGIDDGSPYDAFVCGT